jgi:hypothetical protein
MEVIGQGSLCCRMWVRVRSALEIFCTGHFRVPLLDVEICLFHTILNLKVVKLILEFVHISVENLRKVFNVNYKFYFSYLAFFLLSDTKQDPDSG